MNLDPHGFEWLDCNDREKSILSYIRKNDEEYVISIFNFTPVPREKYRIGVPDLTSYKIIMNSDSEYYGGSNVHNSELIAAESIPWSDKPYSIELNLPPLAGIVLQKT